MRQLFSYAFRPFFLLNGIFAVVVMAVWMATLHGAGPAGLPADVSNWHGHEMLVGFAMAAVAGFVLTAVATWTGRAPLSGLPLVLLVLAWVAGRVAMSFSGKLSPGLVLLLDMSFPVLLLALIAREVFGGGSNRNYPIVFIVFLLGLFNLLYHAGTVGFLPLALDAESVALSLLLHLLLLLITVIAGRIIPNFTANWLRARGSSHAPGSSPLVDRATILLTIATGLFVSFAPLSSLTGLLAFGAAIMQAIRLSRWCGLHTTAEPLLLVLHAAYLFLPVGYVLTGCSVFGWLVPPSAAMHTLTVGAVGLMILAVTTRVSLAHTGRPLHAARLTVIAYVALALAAILRVVSPLGGYYLTMLDMSLTAWMIAFALFVWVYTPILLAPRVDEDPLD